MKPSLEIHAKVMQKMENDNSQEAKFDMMERTNLLGQVGMILCWYWGDEAGDEPDCDGDTMIQAVSLVPSFLSGDYDDFSQGDWWLFYDALGSYPNRIPILDELFEIAVAGHQGTLDLSNTKNFLYVDDEDDMDDGFEEDDEDEMPPSVPFSPELN